LALFWFALVPVTGAFVCRWSWRLFRRRFDDLRLRPLLDYTRYSAGEEGLFRFTGGFESITDGHTLWIRGRTLTIPVSLNEAHTYVLPMPESGAIPAFFDPAVFDPAFFDPGGESPERIRWDKVTTLAEGVKVFAGGMLLMQDKRLTFVSTKETPLLVIFYEGPDRSLTSRVVRSGRHRNEYWNTITPYALILGIFCQLFVAVNYISRPAFRLTVITAASAALLPLFPLIPPGIIFTILYRQLWRRARIFRAYRDLVMLPLIYLPGGQAEGTLPSGERYGAVYRHSLSPEEKQGMPQFIPRHGEGKERGWYIFGALPPAPDTGALPLPVEPQDVFAVYGAVPGNPSALARKFTLYAYILEIVSWLILLTGIGLNAFFLAMIVNLLGG
jgi:hypothetical protein